MHKKEEVGSSSKDYKEWLASSRSDLLWLAGKPGSGKSTLVKSIVKRLVEEKDSTEDIAPLRTILLTARLTVTTLVPLRNLLLVGTLLLLRTMLTLRRRSSEASTTVFAAVILSPAMN